MRKPGPKLALDDIKKAEICVFLAQGGSRRAAARYVGCAHNTIGSTAKRDDAFAEQIRKAEMQCELNALTQINASGGKSWRAAAWILERTRPEQYEKITLRQPTFEQISDFWDECADIVLQGLPDEHRGPVERRLEKASRRFARQTNVGGGKSPRSGKNEQEGVSTPLGARVARPQPPGKPQAFGDSQLLDRSGEPAFDPHAALAAMESVEQNQARRVEAFPPRLVAKHEQRRQELEIENLREWREEYYSLPTSDDDDEPDWIEQLREAKIPEDHPAYEEFSRPPSGKPYEGVKGYEGVNAEPSGRRAGMVGAAVLLGIALTCGALLSVPLSRGVYPRAKAAETTIRADWLSPASEINVASGRDRLNGTPQAILSAGINPAARRAEVHLDFDQQPRTPPWVWSKLPVGGPRKVSSALTGPDDERLLAVTQGLRYYVA